MTTQTGARRADIAKSLRFRDALHEWDHVESELVFEGVSETKISVSVVIPTFKRPRLLVEAVGSVLAQDVDRSFELVIVDNDPQSRVYDDLVERYPELGSRPFRYYRNPANIGMFGNFNRCLQLARGAWTTLLNDDDLLDPNFLSVILAAIDADPRIDGISCQKRVLYQSVVIKPPSPLSPRRFAKRMLVESLFMGGSNRRITPRKLFWGLMIGNSVGFIFRTHVARALGGFYPEEQGSADFWFTTRFAALYDLRQYRETLASLRVAENETGQPDAVKGQMMSANALRLALLGTFVPAYWKRLMPMLIARDRAAYHEHWNVDLPVDELAQLLGSPIGVDRPYLLWFVKLLLRGY